MSGLKLYKNYKDTQTKKEVVESIKAETKTEPEVVVIYEKDDNKVAKMFLSMVLALLILGGVIAAVIFAMSYFANGGGSEALSTLF